MTELADFTELANFTELAKFTEKGQTHGKVRTPRKEVPAPQPTPIYKLSMTSMVWSILSASLGWLPGCAPSQLPHTCMPVEFGSLKKKSSIS